MRPYPVVPHGYVLGPFWGVCELSLGLGLAEVGMVGVVKWLGVGGSGGAIGLAARPEVRRSRIFTGLTDGVSEELEYARSNGEGRFFVRIFPADLAVAAIYRCRLPPGSVLARPGLKFVEQTVREL